MIAENLDWESASEARVPVADLPRLAQLRNRTDIRVRLSEKSAWLNWKESHTEVVAALMPLANVIFYRSANKTRFRLGQLIPTRDAPPIGADRPLNAVLVPARLGLIQPDNGRTPSIELSLVRCDIVRPTTALVCEVAELKHLADTATSFELAAIRGILSDERALLFGSSLPPIVGALRLHGGNVLLPIGFRTEPEIPAVLLRKSVGAEPGEILLVTARGWELIPADLVEPLTRAGIRLALTGGPSK